MATSDCEIINPAHTGARLKVRVEPPGKLYSIPMIKTVAQLLQFFDIQQESALVARGGKLLTPDRHLWRDDEILLRIVGSRG